MSECIPTAPGVTITPEWLNDELRRIAASMTQPTSQLFDEMTIPPSSPKEGLVVFADGTAWNPGAGRGLYLYTGGAWTKL